MWFVTGALWIGCAFSAYRVQRARHVEAQRQLRFAERMTAEMLAEYNRVRMEQTPRRDGVTNVPSLPRKKEG